MTTSNIPQDKMVKQLLIRDLGLVVIWTLVHPIGNKYTFNLPNPYPQELTTLCNQIRLKMLTG